MIKKKVNIGLIGHVDHNKTSLIAQTLRALDDVHVYRNAMDVFTTDGIGRRSEDKKPVELTKYDHQAILKNEIKQGIKARKRLSRR